jgi:hypothetical protein
MLFEEGVMLEKVLELFIYFEKELLEEAMEVDLKN